MCKRTFFLIFLGLLALTLAACGGGESPEATGEPLKATLVPANTASPDPAAAPTTESATATPVATEGDFFLQLISPPELEAFTETGTLTVAGRTRVDAVVTINDSVVEPNIDGEFSLDVPLEEGPNIIEVVASVDSGEQLDLVLVAIYLP